MTGTIMPIASMSSSTVMKMKMKPARRADGKVNVSCIRILSGEGIIRFAERHPNRDARQFECLAQRINEVARVRIRQCPRPRTKQDEARRPRLRLRHVA